MRVKTNRTESNSEKQIRTLFILMVLAVAYFIAFSSSGFAQKSRPTPTPKSTIPAVVSRDADSIRKSSGNDVRETLVKENAMKLPRESSAQSSNNADGSTKKQKKMMLYLDLLTRTEQRAASLQKQLFELIEKQNSLMSKIKQLEYQLRPEVISSMTRLTGSLRPEDLREQRKQSLKLDKTNAETLLLQLDRRRSMLELNAQKADALVEKIRVRFDKIVDDALNEDIELF